VLPGSYPFCLRVFLNEINDPHTIPKRIISGRNRKESEILKILEMIAKIYKIRSMMRFLTISLLDVRKFRSANLTVGMYRVRAPGSLFVTKMYSRDSSQLNPHLRMFHEKGGAFYAIG